MKVSLIAAVYRDVRALELIIDAMRAQTYTNFELVVAEDGEDHEISKLIQHIKDIDIKHTTQQDKGIRKSRSQNNGILTSTGDYLIFIDGDCIPYSNFIEAHVSLSKKKTIITGRRVNLGQIVSRKIRNRILSPLHLQTHYIRSLPMLIIDHTRNIEHGIYLDDDSIVNKLVMSKRKRTASILGCNFSCYRDDIYEINGFDESYEGTALGDDTDLQWRFLAAGMRLKSASNRANMFHLFHTREHRNIDYSYSIQLMRKRQAENEYVCQYGISTHQHVNV